MSSTDPRRDTGCPGERVLEEYVAGNADPRATTQITEHLEQCRTCSERVEEARLDESLSGSVRRALEGMQPLRGEPGDSEGRVGATGDDDAPLGRYKILRQIGEGGMGIVFEAEQKNPQRIVALKLIRPGVSSASALRRFELEAQVLGRLHHPGIAQIYEAGTFTGVGGPQPFFAMELIRGRSLLRYLAEARPPLRARLSMFVAICDAVHHAHQKGVIHRDLKPANILVGEDGRPRVLDFGIARLVDADRPRATQHTRAGQITGTLPYMSPEQLREDAEGIDTRADVYALGVLLHEMLTGRLPLDLTDLALPDAIRAVEEQEPRPMSVWDRSLRGDLETIVATALQKERERRYPSAWDLGEDVQRFLRDEPILARPPSTFYQLRKFSKRNKGLVGGIAGAFLVLVVGIVATATQLVRAQKAERDANAQRLEVQDEALAMRAAVDFLKEVLIQAAPSARGVAEPSARDMLERAAEMVDDDLAQHLVVRGAVHHVLGDVYIDLHDPGRAEAHLRKALDDFERCYGERNRKIAYVLSSLADLLRRQARYDEARACAERALDMRDTITPNLARVVPDCLGVLSGIAHSQGRTEEAIRFGEQAADEYRRIEGDDSPSLAAAWFNLARFHEVAGEMDQARELFERSLAIERELRGERHPATANVFGAIAGVLRKTGQLEEAEKLQRQALAVFAEFYGAEHPRIVMPMASLAVILWHRGERDAAVEQVRLALRLQRDHQERGTTFVQVLGTLGWMLRDLDRPDEAEACFREAVEIAHEQLGESDPFAIQSDARLGKFLVDRARGAEGAPLLERVLRNAPDAVWARKHVAPSLRALAGWRARRGEVTAARGHLTDLLRRLEAWGEADSHTHREVTRELAGLDQ